MIRVDKINFQGENYLHSCRVPDYAKILDISFDNHNSQLEVLYQFPENSPSDKIFNIWITENRNLQEPGIYGEQYWNYWGKVQRMDIHNVELSYANNGRIPVTYRNETYYIFLMEIKSASELRNQKIDTLTNG